GAAALSGGASVLCVATVAEGIELRDEFRQERILVMGPTATNREIALAREAGLELVVSTQEIPEGMSVHLKLDTGMGRWGLSELPEPPDGVVGLTRHRANSAGALRFPDARFDAARCGVAIYGLSPFGRDPGEDGLEPAMHWASQLAQVRQLAPGESTGYGRRF